MKNKLIKRIFGFGLMISLFAITTGVYANTYDGATLDDSNNSTSEEVVVGNVAVPVYSADIFWDSLSFDWVYDSSTKSFEWAPTAVCNHFYPQNEMTWEDAFASETSIYTDSTCSTKANTYDENIQEYYYLEARDSAQISIWDMSQNGEIVPSIVWNSNDKYTNVNGIFSYIATESVCSNISSENMLNYALEKDVTIFSDSSCSSSITEQQLTYGENMYYAFVNVDFVREASGEIPDIARKSAAGSIDEYNFTELVQYFYPRNIYRLDFTLKNDPEKDAVTPSKGDVIGTITISIRAR